MKCIYVLNLIENDYQSRSHFIGYRGECQREFLNFISEELDNLKCYDNLNYKIYGGELLKKLVKVVAAIIENDNDEILTNCILLILFL